MEQTLYGDILFLVNFTMDFLTLYITAVIGRRSIKTGRLCLSSAIGAVYGVAACFMNGPIIFTIAVNLTVSYIMCVIAYKKRILPCYALFYGIGCLLGGAMTAFFGFLGGMSGTPTVSASEDIRTLPGKIPLGWMAVTALVIGIAAIAGGRFVKKKGVARDCRVGVITDKGAFVFEGIYDSGNLLKDPMSGRAVIVLRKKEMIDILPEQLKVSFESEDPSGFSDLDTKAAASIRLIPSSSVGGSRLLMGYLPKRISIDGIEKNAVLAMGDENGYDGRAALVPAELG